MLSSQGSMKNLGWEITYKYGKSTYIKGNFFFLIKEKKKRPHLIFLCSAWEA